MGDLSVTGSRIGAGFNTPAAKSNRETKAQETVAGPPAKNTGQPAQRPAAPEPPINSRLSIERDESSGRYVFRSIDPDTGNVLAQYPTEKMLSLFAHVRKITGLTVDKDV